MSRTAALAPDLSESRALALRQSRLLVAAKIDAFRLLTRLATKLTGARAAVVAVATGGQSWFQSAEGLPAPFGSIPPGEETLCHRVLGLGRSVSVDDVLSDPGIAATWEVRTLEVRALLAVPLRLAEGPAFGVLVVMEFGVRAWTPADLRVAEELVAGCITQIEDHQAVERQAAQRAVTAEDGLVRSEERFRRFVEMAPDALFVAAGRQILYANTAAVRLCGGETTDDVAGHPLDRFIEGPYLKRVREQILGEGAPAPLHAESLRRLDGTFLHVEVAAIPFVYAGLGAVLVFVHDVTQRYRAEIDLAQQEAWLRMVLQQIPVYAWATDTDLRVTSVTGGSPERPHPVPHPVNASLEVIFDQHGIEDPALMAHVRAIAGDPTDFRAAWRGRLFAVRVEPLVGHEGAVVGSVAVAMDITEQARMEEHLRETAEREALGRVAGGVAHEMNNILAAILGISSARQGGSTGDVSDFARISAAARRGGAIAADLLGFAGKGLYRRETVPLEALVRVVSQQARRDAAQGIEVQVDGAPGTPDVEGDRAQLEQALLHLCDNGLAAMSGEGVLTLRACPETFPATDGDASARVSVRIEVTDTGVGMPEEVRARAVEPFFSTRPLGQGVGLGLSMAFGVVRNHQGTLSLESTPGAGTTVVIRLPAADATPRAASVPALPIPRSRDRATVLVVDDDDWVRESTSRLLEELGYTVMATEDGATAVELFLARPGAFDVVLLDLRMPLMDGDEVLRLLVGIDPTVRVILCTGYDRDQISPALFALGNVGFLAKPFGMEELGAEIAAIAPARV